MYKKRFSVVILKPDCIRDGLTDSIKKRLEQAGICIEAMLQKVLEYPEVDTIYSRMINLQFYDTMRRLLVSEAVEILLVSYQRSDTDIEDVLKGIKGHTGIPGTIRGDYCVKKWYSEDEMRIWENGQHPDQDQMTRHILMENRIHTVNNQVESKKLINLFFNNIRPSIIF